MEVKESCPGVKCLEEDRQKLLNGSMNYTCSPNTGSDVVTEKDILELFDNSEESLRYYLGLKEVMAESWKDGCTCWCDPRDLKAREHLDLSGWKPRVILKLFGDQGVVDHDGCGFSTKQLALDEDGEDEEEKANAEDAVLETDIGDIVTEKESDKKSFPCGYQGCNQSFTSLSSFESHYQTCHNYVCAVCRSSFVTNFHLDIHLQENHDSYFQILSPRIDMYRCLVESCSLKFRTSELRKDHLVKEHNLPASFMFHKPLKAKSQKCKANQKSSSSCARSGEVSSMDIVEDSSSQKSQSPPSVCSESMETEVGIQPSSGTLTSPGKSVKSKTGSRGRGANVPHNICFGRGSQRTFQSHRSGGGRRRRQHWHQINVADVDTAVDIEKVDFSDMAESLGCT